MYPLRILTNLIAGPPAKQIKKVAEKTPPPQTNVKGPGTFVIADKVPLDGISKLVNVTAKTFKKGGPWTIVTLFKWILVLAIIGLAIHYAIKYFLFYTRSRSFSVRITFTKSTLIVGETIVAKLTFLQLAEDHFRNIVENPCPPEEMLVISTLLKLTFHTRNNLGSREKHPIAVLKTFTPDKEAIMIRFSARKSGNYELSCLCGHFNFVGSPLEFKIQSGPISPDMTSVDLSCPEILPLTMGQWKFIEILPKDRYGNISSIRLDQMEDHLRFDVFNGESPADAEEIESGFYLQDSESVGLKLKANICGVFKASVKYSGKAIHTRPMTIVSMSEEEMIRFDADMTSFFRYLPGASKAKVLAVGTRGQEPINVWISVNYRQITLSSLTLGFIYYPFLAFPITRKTKITYLGSHSLQTDVQEETVTLKISDGVQDSITLLITASDARILIATFATFAGPKLQKETFTKKVETLKKELSGIFYGRFQKLYLLNLDPANILHSSIINAPKTPADWKKPFFISLKRNTEAAPSQTLPIPYWLTMVSKQLFGDECFQHEQIDKKGKGSSGGDGLFFRRPGSMRIQPNRLTPGKLPLSYLEFSGAILAKSLYESVVRGECLDMTRVRLTRSLLAQISGAPVTYKCFETDSPKFYVEHIRPLLLNDEDETTLRFEYEDGNGVTSSLIPNGSNIPVTKRNKEYYLNLLATQILKEPFQTEINAFRTGFYKVIPHGFVANFDEDELERLICGGGSKLNLEDFKTNSIIIGELDANSVPSSTDLNASTNEISRMPDPSPLKWFWICVSNMTEDEHLKLIKFATGSSLIPSCGFKDLCPKFTISLRGPANQEPLGYPEKHEIAIGTHSSFEHFEGSLLQALYREKSEFGEDFEEDTNENEENDEMNENTPQDEQILEEKNSSLWLTISKSLWSK